MEDMEENEKEEDATRVQRRKRLGCLATPNN